MTDVRRSPVTATEETDAAPQAVLSPRGRARRANDVIPPCEWIAAAVNGAACAVPRAWTVVCAWCERDKPVEQRARGERVSHGICAAHAEPLTAAGRARRRAREQAEHEAAALYTEHGGESGGA